LPLPNEKTTETRVEIKPAKGRPMLTWVGKKPLRHAIAYPAQLVETFHAAPARSVRAVHEPPLQNENALLFHGDNKDVLAYLLANGYRGKVKLIYIDPPFDSGADYIRKVTLRNGAANLEGEGYALGEQIQYADIWANDSYLQFMYERVALLRELLSEDGTLWLHCDPKKNFQLRAIVDEVFSSDNFINEVIWFYSNKITDSSKKIFQRSHDTILGYSKSSNYTWISPFEKRPTTVKNKKVIKVDGKRVNARDEEGKLIYTETDVKAMLDVWDIPIIGSRAEERMEYPTQKPVEVVERIINAGSLPNDIVLDCFIGSGTTAAVAQKLGRRWIGADINKGAIQTTVKRLQGVTQEQAGAIHEVPLPGMENEETPPPAQLGFAVYRVNDYDLQIQHNEAFNLAVEHLGMTRSKTDAYFDGTLGKKLVKIVPFNHPVTPLDLEEVKRELNNRPDEERDIVVVGLGKEVAVNGWLEDWNKLRKQGNIPNKIEVIELRSDPKYGGFFTHEPAKAKVSFKRVKNSVEIAIDDFISPTILERLRQQNKDNPLFQPQVTDWRSMVDSVMIDSAYDGRVFNIALADVPERKNDLVEGKYSVEAKKGAIVAVKVTDMLGEEVLVVREI
jgi:DNA modification methylase